MAIFEVTQCEIVTGNINHKLGEALYTLYTKYRAANLFPSDEKMFSLSSFLSMSNLIKNSIGNLYVESQIGNHG